MKFEQILTFIQAGNSTFTLQSTKLDTRYTYNIKQDKKCLQRFYVKVMYGNDNEKDYRFLGWFYEDNLTLRYSDKSCAKFCDSCFVMLKKFLEILCNCKELPATCKFYPSGKCGRCGRKLTTPESIERGVGPECYLQGREKWSEKENIEKEYE